MSQFPQPPEKTVTLRHSPTLRTCVLTLLIFPVALSLAVPAADAAEYRFLENGTPLHRGEDTGFLAETSTRIALDLSGAWEYAVEGGPSGTVNIPAAYDFVGKVSFRRKVRITAEQLDRYDFHIVMFGANYSTEVLVNGEFITNHAGGYTSFTAPIRRNILQVGEENVVQVITDNTLDARETLPLRSLVWSWRNYGGITRDVFLLGTPRTYIQDVDMGSVVTGDAASARVQAAVTVDGGEGVEGPAGSGPLAFSFELFDKISGVSVGKSAPAAVLRSGNRWSAASSELVLSPPKLWSPESPELYVVKCRLTAGTGADLQVVDEYILTWGISTVAEKDGDLLLNGKRIVLRGVIWQEDHPAWGSALTHEARERDIALIKTLGANAVRFAGRPPHPYMLNLCDRYGLLALQEIPLADAPARVLEREEFRELAAGTLREMVLRDRNHASMLAWGLGDRFESSSTGARGFVEALARQARALDARPLYYGARLTGGEACADIVDFLLVTPPVGDAKEFKAGLQAWHERQPGKPLIVGRLGAEVQPGNRNGYSDPLSAEAQARFFIQRFDALRSLEHDGAFVWTFNDWKGDRPALTVNSGDPWMHTPGLVSADREKRLSFEAVRSVYRAEKFVALPIGNYTPSAPIIFVLAGLVVLIGVAYLYNASRRFRESLNRSLMNSYNFFADVRDQRVVSMIHSALLALIVSAAAAIVLTSILHHFRGSWVLDNLLSYLLVSDGLKELVIGLIRSPLLSILYLTVFIFVKLTVVAGVMLLLSPLFKVRIYPYHAYAITTWSTPPLLALVPLGMILFRLLETPLYVVPALVLVGVLLVWVLLRFLKGLSIIFDAPAPQVYVVGVVGLLAVVGLAYLYYDYTQSTSVYLSFMYHVAAGAR